MAAQSSSWAARLGVGLVLLVVGLFAGRALAAAPWSRYELHVVEGIARIEGKLDRLDERVRALEIKVGGAVAPPG